MNVVYILDNLDRGGTQTQLRHRISGLAARGYRQHVICLSDKLNPEVVEATRQAGASVEIIGRPSLFTTFGFWRIVRELRRRQPDLVHTELPSGDVIGRTAARMAGIRPVVSRITGRYAGKRWHQFLLDRATIRWADRVVFVSPEIIPFSIARHGVQPDQIVCIRNGVDPDDANRIEAAAALRRRYGGGARTIIGMVARLHPPKDHPDLLTAFANVAGRRNDLRLWLVGDGPERGRLTAQARDLGLEDLVLFAGDRNDARDWTAAMDIFVHPSHFEGLPNAVLEAMAAGKPVIASFVDGVQGLITSGIDGWLVDPGNPAALTEAIQYALDHPDEAARIGRAGAERVLTHFSLARQVDEYDRLFRSLVSGRAA